MDYFICLSESDSHILSIVSNTRTNQHFCNILNINIIIITTKFWNKPISQTFFSDIFCRFLCPFWLTSKHIMTEQWHYRSKSILQSISMRFPITEKKVINSIQMGTCWWSFLRLSGWWTSLECMCLCVRTTLRTFKRQSNREKWKGTNSQSEASRQDFWRGANSGHSHITELYWLWLIVVPTVGHFIWFNLANTLSCRRHFFSHSSQVVNNSHYSRQN